MLDQCLRGLNLLYAGIVERKRQRDLVFKPVLFDSSALTDDTLVTVQVSRILFLGGIILRPGFVRQLLIVFQIISGFFRPVFSHIHLQSLDYRRCHLLGNLRILFFDRKDDHPRLFIDGKNNILPEMADNSILSTQIANANIQYYGKGVLADKQKPGWFTRLMDNIWPF